MFELKPDHISPTPEESEAIRAAIAEDPDTFELNEEWFREAKPLKEVLPHLWEQWYGNGQNSEANGSTSSEDNASDHAQAKT